MFLLTSYSETKYIQIKSILENNERHLGKANSCLGVKMTFKRKKKNHYDLIRNINLTDIN